MAYTLILGSGKKDIIDIYKEELTHGVLIKSALSGSLNEVYDEQSLSPLTSTPLLRMKELQFVNNDNEYIVNNNFNTFAENQIFSQYVLSGVPTNKIGLFKLEGTDYRLNGLINITEIAPSVDTPVLINLNIKIIDNL